MSAEDSTKVKGRILGHPLKCLLPRLFMRLAMILKAEFGLIFRDVLG